jgi:ABC-type glycerol-3-phosphate transport system permease component
MANTTTVPNNELEAPKRHPKSQRVDWGKVAAYTILIVWSFIALIPFFYTISVSLMNLTEATGGAFLPRAPQWGNYIQAWDDANFSLFFWNTVKITLIIVTGQVIFCTMASYAFAMLEFPGKNFIFLLILATLLLPEAITWVPNFITVSWLGRMGPIPWINNWPALTIPFMATAFSIFLLRQFFMQIPLELWDAAQIDGASHIRYLLQVVVPLSKAPIVTVVLFGFIGSWNALAWPILVTTTEEWRIISYGLFSFITDAGAQFHLQMAGAVISMLPIVLLYFVAQKQFTEGIARSGLKG